MSEQNFEFGHEADVSGTAAGLPYRDITTIPAHESFGSDAGQDGAMDDVSTEWVTCAIPHPASHPGSAGGDGTGHSQASYQDRCTLPTVAKSRRKAKEPTRTKEQAIAEIVEYGRLWRDAVRATTGLTNQAKGICRRYLTTSHEEWEDEKARAKIVKAAGELYKRVIAGEGPIGIGSIVMGFETAKEPFEALRKQYEKAISAAVRDLLIWHDFVAPVKGISEVWFGLIISEAGDIGAYPKHDRLWKRMGLAVIEGERQRKCVDAEKAAKHGYSPVRRSTMWVVGNGLIGGMGNGYRPMSGEDIDAMEGRSPYEKLFMHRLRREAEKDPSARLPDKPDGKESYTLAAKMKAKRYVEKKFLRDLWVAWRRGDDVDLPKWVAWRPPHSTHSNAA